MERFEEKLEKEKQKQRTRFEPG